MAKRSAAGAANLTAAEQERLARVNADLARKQQERDLREQERQRAHERRLQAQRIRSSGSGGRSGYAQFTPPQAFISGNAPTHISGAPTAFDVGLTLASAVGSTLWAATRDHSTGGDIGWATFLGLTGVVLMVEGHAEAHAIGVGVAPAMAGYLGQRLIGGSVQPTTL